MQDHFNKSDEIAHERCIETLLNCFYRETLVSGQYVQMINSKEIGNFYTHVPETIQNHTGSFMRLKLTGIGEELIIAVKYDSKIGCCQYQSKLYFKTSHSTWKESNWRELAVLLLKELAHFYSQPFNHELLEQIQNSVQVMSANIDVHLRSVAKKIEDLKFIDSEQNLLFGHTFHPSPKSRENLTSQDIHAFSPESGTKFPLYYFSVKKDYLVQESLLQKSAIDLLQENAPKYLRKKEDHLFLCTHPWQARYLKKLTIVKNAMENGYLCDLGQHGESYYPTSSIRTVYHSDNQFFYKFSLNIRITNCVRKNAIYELKTSVFLTKIILMKAKELRERFLDFHIMLEPAFLSIDLPDGLPDERQKVTEGFGMIFRENFYQSQLQGAEPILAATLFGRSLAGNSYIFQNIENLSKKLQVDYETAAEKWFSQYLEKLIHPILYCHFNLGITFEPHLQNTLIGMKNFMPHSIFIRDLEGTKIRAELWPSEIFSELGEQEKQSMYYSEPLAWNRIAYCLIVNNIGEAIFHISHASHTLEITLWNIVRKHLLLFQENYETEHSKSRIHGLLADEALPVKGNLTTRFLKRADRGAVYYYLTDHPLQKKNLKPHNVKYSTSSKEDVEAYLMRRILHACVREQLLAYVVEEKSLYISLVRSHQTIVVEEVESSSIRTFQMKGEITLKSHNESVAIRNLEYLLRLIGMELAHGVEPSQWQRFMLEANDSLENGVLVKECMDRFNGKLAEKVKYAGFKTLIEYISSKYLTQEQLIFFESWAVKANEYHPCNKTKLGFTKEDFLQYAPEFNQDVNLIVAAVEQTIIHLESEEEGFDYHAWFARTYPNQWQAVEQQLRENGCSAQKFFPIFIHPWQYEHLVKKLYYSYIANKKLVVFPGITIKMVPSLSFRTLIARNDIQQPHVKLAVAVQSTGTVRTISPASIENGPKVGKILRKILAVENNFNQTIQLAHQNFGLHFKHDDVAIQRNLAIIYRENPGILVKLHQVPIVAAALFEISPVTQLPLFIEMMQCAVGTTLCAAEKYFSKYCEVIIGGYFDLFLIYGIALEGHQQNTIVVFENYSPSYLIARDWDGIRIHMPTLNRHGFVYKTHPLSATVTDNSFEVTYKFIHAVIQYQLGELVLLLKNHFRTSEVVFWRIIKRNLEHRFHALRPRVNHERWEEVYKSMFYEDWRIKSLMHMRLKNIHTEYIYTTVKNPLRDL